MTIQGRYIPPATFAFTLFCFLLPFLTISCPGASVTLTGAQLVTGATLDPSGELGMGEEAKIESEPLALLALLSALAGLGLTATKDRTLRKAGAALAVVGAILLFLLKLKIDRDAMEQGRGMIKHSFGIGYWMALLGFVAVVAQSLFLSAAAIVSPKNDGSELAPAPTLNESETSSQTH